MGRQHVVPSFLFAAALIGGAAGCGGKEPAKAPTTGEAEPQAGQMPAAPANFTFAPPSGTRYTRTERRRYDSSLVGTPLTARREQELRWQVSVDRSGDQYMVTQQLTHLMVKRNDETVLDADVPANAISAQLVIDRAGNLVDVRGLDNTSFNLQSLARAGFDELENRELSPQGLKGLVAMRYNVLTGDIVGHPAKPGSTWTIPGRPNSPVTSRTMTVDGMQTCGTATCARLRVDLKLDPSQISAAANQLVKTRVQQAGGDASKVRVQDAMSSLAGSIVTEPATMLNHEASMSDNSHVTVIAPDRNYELVVRGMTQYLYEYGRAPVAAAGHPER